MEAAAPRPLKLQYEILAHCPIPDAKALELRGFEFFLTRTAPEMSCFFDSNFWQRFVLQLSRTEPLVLHAAIALGTLHENEESLGMPIARDRLTDFRHQFAVAQYNTAINLLTTQTYDSDEECRLITLATCLLFIHIEFMRGRYDLALAHIRSGLSISQGVLPELEEGTTEAMLSTALARLDLQGTHFDPDKLSPVLRYPSALLLLRKYLHIADAKKQCDLLLGSTFRFLEVCQVRRSEGQLLNDNELATQQKELLEYYQTFLRDLDSLSERKECKHVPREEGKMTLLLKMHARVGFVMVAVSTEEDEESAYDDHIATFTEMVALATELTLKFKTSKGSQSALPTLATDWGIIPPLFVTAIKCRDSVIRRSAVDLLDSWPHREGFWDSRLVSRIASQVIKVEEGSPEYVKEIVETVDNIGSIPTRVTDVYGTIDDDHQIGSMTWIQVTDLRNGLSMQELRIPLEDSKSV